MMVGFNILIIFSHSMRKSAVTVTWLGEGGRRGSADARIFMLFFLNQLQ